MLTGTIKFFQKTKGFGFITPDEGTAEVFLPASAIAPADVPKLTAGQRVTFEQAPDTKGPKAVSLKLLEEKRRDSAATLSQIKLTVLYDPSSSASDEVLQELEALGYEMHLVDYVTSPPSPDELKKISLMLGGSNFGLVRRHDPLFSGLQLDDRFISENDFWTAISQHPTLINGPVLATVGRAGICKTRVDVRLFAGISQPREIRKPKGISARLAALMTGQMPSAHSESVKTENYPATKKRDEAKPTTTEPKLKQKPKTKTIKPARSKSAKAVKKVAAEKPRKATKKR